jgi:DNA-binding NarL/FixJ family response regulator
VIETMRTGASGYVVKDCAPDKLVTAIEAVATGERHLSPSLTSMLLDTYSGSDSVASSSKLTRGETEVLQLLAKGRAMKQAADDLGVAQNKDRVTHRK